MKKRVSQHHDDYIEWLYIWLRVRVIESDDDDKRDEYESRHSKRRNNILKMNVFVIHFIVLSLFPVLTSPTVIMMMMTMIFYSVLQYIISLPSAKNSAQVCTRQTQMSLHMDRILEFSFFFTFFKLLQIDGFGKFRWKFIIQLYFSFKFFLLLDSIEFFMYRSDPFHNQSTNEINFRDIKLFSLYFCFFSSLIYEED